MRGKYGSFTSYAAAKLQRGILRTMLRGLTSWEPLHQTEPGYTIVIACHGPLAEMVLPSLDLVARQDLTDVAELIVVFDRPRDQALSDLAVKIVEKYPQLKPKFEFQSAGQSALLRRIGWGWVDCWLSYCKGLAATRTKYAILHDMDAMLLRRDVIRERYRLISERGDHFVGCRWYEGNGIVPEDRLAYIVEMALDVEFLRRTSRPLDLFNVIARIGDRTVDYDTLLFPQTRTERRSIAPINERDMVHPSQVVSQFTMLDRAGYVPPASNNALFIPYFYYLAGHDQAMTSAQAGLGQKRAAVPLLGRIMDVSRLTVAHALWLTKQAMRIEIAVAGAPRDSVVSYFKAIRTAAEARNA